MSVVNKTKTKIAANKSSSVRKTKQNSLMLLSNSTISCKKKSAFIKIQELHNFDDFLNN